MLPLAFLKRALDNFSITKIMPAIGALKAIAKPAAVPAETQLDRLILGKNLLYLSAKVAKIPADM